MLALACKPSPTVRTSPHGKPCINKPSQQDTFLDAQHVRDSFPLYDVSFADADPRPPFRITFPKQLPTPDAMDVDGARPALQVASFTPPNQGPYPQDAPPRNTVRFTPVQVEAICAGVQPGLSMVVGPPGGSWCCVVVVCGGGV